MGVVFGSGTLALGHGYRLSVFALWCVPTKTCQPLLLASQVSKEPTWKKITTPSNIPAIGDTTQAQTKQSDHGKMFGYLIGTTLTIFVCAFVFHTIKRVRKNN